MKTDVGMVKQPLSAQRVQELQTQLPSEIILRHWVHRP